MPKTILFSGYAKLPSNITANELYDILACVVEIEKETGIIIEVDCTFATELSRNFVKRMLSGYDLLNDFDKIIAEIEVRYQGSAQKALITAVKKIKNQYYSYVKRNGLRVNKKVDKF